MDYDNLAKKDLGQHWLNDAFSLDAIRDMADINKKDTILEIGPGLGSLTERLVEKAERVIAVELDSSLIEGLKKKFKGITNLEIEQADIRKFNLTVLPQGYKIVANIPYYLTSYLIRMLSQTANPPILVVLLVQQEVAQRLAASPGELSLLAITTQMKWSVEIGAKVSAKLFIPPPKVDSQIVCLSKRKQSLVNQDLEKLFIRTLKIGFSQKRKTLANSLSGGFHISKSQADESLLMLGLNPKIRPQELNIKQWISLTRIINLSER